MSSTVWLLELSNTSYPYLKYSRLLGLDYGAVLLYVSQPDENNLIEAHAARILSNLQPTHFRDIDRLRRMVATRELRNEIVKHAKAKARTFADKYIQPDGSPPAICTEPPTDIVRLGFGPGGDLTVEPGTKKETTTMARVVMKFHGFASSREIGLEYRGWYLKSFDHEAHNGRGDAVFTPHIEQALSFTDMASALDFYNRRSRIMPTRPDGQPNRPLTSSHIELLYVTPALQENVPEVGGGPA